VPEPGGLPVSTFDDEGRRERRPFYSFTGADPDFCEAFAVRHSPETLTLTENRRAEPAAGKRDNAQLWIEALESGQVFEEVRVAYVALTRARRYCAVALPDACHPDVVARFVAAGFRLVEDAVAPPERKPHAPPRS